MFSAKCNKNTINVDSMWDSSVHTGFLVTYRNEHMPYSGPISDLLTKAQIEVLEAIILHTVQQYLKEGE